MTSMPMTPQERAFTAPYRDIGDEIPVQLETYLRSCWLAYAREPSRFIAPSAALVQSSGFGKSRLVYELARRTKPAGHDMRVLYTCLASPTNFRSYPWKMSRVPQYLFPLANARVFSSVALADVLSGLFAKAMARWDSVGEEWCALITDRDNDEKTLQILENDDFPECTCLPEASPRPCMTEETRRVLVLTVDAAQELLRPDVCITEPWLYELERALVDATTHIRAAYGPYAGVMALLVGDDPRIATASKHHAVDPRREAFPPFVLTQTMDVFYNELMRASPVPGLPLTRVQLNQQHVLASKAESHKALVAMGRPLWQSRFDELGFDGVVGLAADRLLAGASASRDDCLTEENLFGVASVLSRVGLRPLSWCPLASRLVATSLAVLSYVGGTRRQCVSTYSSEPMVTFGAARVWYHSRHSRDILGYLERDLLPQLRKLLMTKQIDDSAGRHLIVARIVLLLVMDVTGVIQEDGDNRRREYQGDFYRVPDFLRVLRGAGGAESDEVAQWLALWEHWQVGFSHFVELSDGWPSDDRLWALLARRAACLVGDTLLLPIFTRGDQDEDGGGHAAVSVIVVSVAGPGDEEDDAQYVPGRTASNGSDVIRISVNFSSKKGHHEREFYRLPRTKEAQEPTPQSSIASYGLSVEGLAAWSVWTNKYQTPVVVSQAIADELGKLLGNDPPPLESIVQPDNPNLDWYKAKIKPPPAAHHALVGMWGCDEAPTATREDVEHEDDATAPAKKKSKRARR